MEPKGGLPAWGAAAIVAATIIIAALLIPGHKGKEWKASDDKFPNDQFASTYKPFPSKPTLIRGATLLTATDKELAGTDILLKDGKIAEIGRGLAAPAGAIVISG